MRFQEAEFYSGFCHSRRNLWQFDFESSGVLDVQLKLSFFFALRSFFKYLLNTKSTKLYTKGTEVRWAQATLVRHY